MTRSRRWWLAAAVLAAVVGLPVAVHARPVRAPDPTAAALLDRVRSAAGHPWSGEVDLLGNLDLPVTSRFTDLGSLLGDRTSLRAWWRDGGHWRVDELQVAGETDLVHDGGLTTQWRYEGNRVVRSADPQVRLPRTADLLPPTLARRVLAGVGPAEVTRVPARRVAGIGAPGLRVRPADARSSVDHVDLWADPRSGVVLRVEVYAAGDRAPSFRSTFSSFSATRPAASRTRFLAPAGATVSFDRALDIADAANQYAPFIPPDRIGGLDRAPTPVGAVGVYGSGLTRLMAVPLRHGDADVLRAQVEHTPGATRTDPGVALRAGPLGVLVVEHRYGSWLVTGLVDEPTLAAAARDLVSGAVLR